MDNNIISFISVKGGVGKTTLALETAYALANNYNKKVLLVDCNFSAPNIGLYLDLVSDLTLHDALGEVPLHNAIYESNGIDIIPASLYYKDKFEVFKLKQILSKFKNRYDFILLDSSPNYDELKPVIAASDRVFIVTTPDHVTLETSLKAAVLAKEEKTPIDGIIVNKIRSPKHEYNLKEIEEKSNNLVIAKIHDSKNVLAAMHLKKPVGFCYSHDCVSKEINRFASSLCGEKEFQNRILQKLLTTISKEKINREIYRQSYYNKQFE